MAPPTPKPRPEGAAFLGNLVRLPLAEKALAAEAAACLALARLLILFIPLRHWNDGVDVGRERVTAPPDDAALDRARRIGRIVRLTARRMPFEALCLPQAVAAQWMLRRRGLSGVIRLGARKPAPDQSMRLHAWLVCGDAVLTGGDVVPAFKPLQPAGSDAPTASDHDRGG